MHLLALTQRTTFSYIKSYSVKLHLSHKRTNEQTDRQTNKQTDRHRESNLVRFQF